MNSSKIFQIFTEIEDLNSFNTFENVKTIYHYSIPNVKLFYPEPFIASPSFMHSDLWFVHILLYQYWLWFVFIFIIVFFFLTFLSTLRWCNMRIKPRRETRGVSRSKCGDLITATVPVSWATSIIVNESTDAIDYYDGFGTTELVVGIRAYQWGWEYYYPKDIDLNYNIKPNYSLFIGNSLKYNKTSGDSLKTNNFWKFYQNKSLDSTITPIFFLLSFFNNDKFINFFNFQDLGLNPLLESNAFKKINLFSKLFTNNLTSYSSKSQTFYQMLNLNYFQNINLNFSQFYGLLKQNNFRNSFSSLSNQTTYFNTEPAARFLKFNNTIAQNTKTPFNVLSLHTHFLNKIRILTEQNFDINLNTSKNSSAKILFFNTNDETKLISNAQIALFNLKKNSPASAVSALLNKNKNLVSELLQQNKTSDFNFFKINYSKYLILNKKLIFLNHPSTNIILADKSIRNFIKNSPKIAFANFKNPLINFSNNFYLTFLPADNLSGLTFLTNFKTDFIDFNNFNNFNSRAVTTDPANSPILSISKNKFILNYDQTASTGNNFFNILQGKEDTIPNPVLSFYWNFFFLNTHVDNRRAMVKNFNSFNFNFYLPTFALYYDYDFRNWQASELFEDAVWENVAPFYKHFEYLDLKTNFTSNYLLNFNKIEWVFNKKNRRLNFPLVTNILEKNFKNFYFTNSFVFNDEFFFNLRLLNTKNFLLFNTNQNFELSHEAYDTKNFFHVFLNNNNKIAYTSALSNPITHSFALILDSFRSDFDEFSWFIDYKPLYPISQFYKNFKDNFSVKISQNLTTADGFSFKLNNNVNLRNTAKNAIVTHNAMQKVFKTRFDENRSHARFVDFSNSTPSLPFLTSSKTPYENILGKNKNTFMDITFYKIKFKQLFNSFSVLELLNNTYFYDFPFLLAFKSDSSRYLWFDWFAKWNYCEIQPSSSSRYAVFGMPYFSKNFEFTGPTNETFVETESYLTRIARSRKNYLTNWAQTPYLYFKNILWYSSNSVFFINSLDFNNILINVKVLLNISSWYWSNHFLINSWKSSFTPSNSNVNSFARAASFNSSSSQGYYYLLSSLTDILTKREILYRDLFFNKVKVVNMSNIFTNNPHSSLFYEIKTLLETFDPLLMLNEYSRDASLFSLKASDAVFGQKINNYFSYFWSKNLLNNSFNNYTNYSFEGKSNNQKNQFRPMRKGVINMIRLHATGAIALPTEMRLQVLASSKDVIHSWAIPSAGIKIDCVPGYSSHRVMIFLVSGIYWGQCMEICGRYHHWMPIVVYFMKRDIFFLWCTHFVHITATNALMTNDRYYVNFNRTVSFNKNSWKNEIFN